MLFQPQENHSDYKYIISKSKNCQKKIHLILIKLYNISFPWNQMQYTYFAVAFYARGFIFGVGKGLLSFSLSSVVCTNPADGYKQIYIQPNGLPPLLHCIALIKRTSHAHARALY